MAVAQGLIFHTSTIFQKLFVRIHLRELISGILILITSWFEIAHISERNAWIRIRIWKV